MHIVWVIIIGFVAGITARLLAPGADNPTGFILTALLGIACASVASLIEQALGFYGPNRRVGVIGAVVILFVWHRLVTNRAIADPGRRSWL